MVAVPEQAWNHSEWPGLKPDRRPGGRRRSWTETSGVFIRPASSTPPNRASLASVLVVATDPQLEPVALVTALRCAVEDGVIAHQELVPTSLRRIRLVDDSVVQNEDAEAGALGQVSDDVGAGVGGVTAGDRRQLIDHRHDPLTRLLFAPREAEPAVEVTARRRHPRDCPAHAAPVGL